MKRRSLLFGIGAGAATIFPSLAFAQSQNSYLDAASVGLVPYSSQDQSETFRKVLLAAQSNGRPVFVPAGTYLIANVTLPPNTTIIGVNGATILATANGEAIFTSGRQSNITLQSLTFEGNGGGTRAAELGLLKFEECASLNIAQCRFQNHEDNGLYLRNCSGRITDCSFYNLGQSAIHGQNSAGLLISGNDISTCGNGGVRIWRHENGWDKTIVTNNQIAKIGSDRGDGQNGNGINIFLADEVVVANNVISECALSAIRANSTNNTIIQGNQCINSSEVAIFSEFAFSGSIISNNLIDGAATGISITNFDEGGRLAICSNNIVRNIMPFSPTNPDTTPIGIFAEADTAINANIVENVPGVGIAVGWGTYLRNVLVSDNIVRQIKYGIAVSVVEGGGHAKISDNMIVDASEGGIVGARWREISSSDLVRDKEMFPQISLSDNTQT
ncbi:MAG: TIGR03808 family TAT-translocated repetitive protein [Devosiaceae bacterium]|nr:TIGR03808 family TAT-translocated repetitive protein [Devosiaceae bacterium]